MENALYFMLKVLFVLKVFTKYLEKALDKKAIVNFKIHAITHWTTNNYNTHIAKYLKK